MNFSVTAEEISRWCCELIARPSYPGIPQQERQTAIYIRDVFAAEGICCEIVPLKGGHVNAIARLPGQGGGKTLLLNGHMDTVPPYDMGNACVPVERGGIIYGRGAADMKGPLASMMGALISLKRSGATLDGDVTFAGVADEEQSSVGTISLLKSGLRADGAVVCEPLGSGCVAVAQRGLEWYAIDVEGRTVHGGSQDEGVNAIEKAACVLDTIENDLKPRLRQRRHPVAGLSTVNIAVIQGGTQPSTVPGHCRIQLDRRFLPAAERYEEVTAELEELLATLASKHDVHASLSVLPESVMEEGFVHQGYETDTHHPLVQGCADAIKAVTGREAQLVTCPCWTDAGLLSYYGGIPSVVWGPGNLTLCHSREECISVDEMTRCAQGYVALAESFCGRHS